MSATRTEIDQLLESLTEKYLRQVRDFVKVLVQEPEELTEQEQDELPKGEEEFRRGEWVKWQDVRRRDVGSSSFPERSSILSKG